MAVDQLSLTFAALADPTRRAILARLSTGPATVNELAQPFPISLQAISRHLKVLEAAGLISRGRDAQFRPCRLETEPLESAASWIEEHRQIWDDRFDQLDRHLLEVQQQRPPKQSGARNRPASKRPARRQNQPPQDPPIPRKRKSPS